jgi:hypothetical protein
LQTPGGYIETFSTTQECYDAQTVMTGQNLFFLRMEVGDHGPVLDLDYAKDGSECRIKSTSQYPSKAEGYLSFLTHDNFPLPVIQVKSSTASQVHHDANPSKAAGGGSAGQTQKTPRPAVPATTQPPPSAPGNIKDIGKALQLLQ